MPAQRARGFNRRLIRQNVVPAQKLAGDYEQSVKYEVTTRHYCAFKNCVSTDIAMFVQRAGEYI
jgi:hypothetical protein